VLEVLELCPSPALVSNLPNHHHLTHSEATILGVIFIWSIHTALPTEQGQTTSGVVKDYRVICTKHHQVITNLIEATILGIQAPCISQIMFAIKATDK